MGYCPTIFPPSSADVAIGEIQRACEEMGYVLLITADHGNAERMIDEDGNPVTKHTTYRGGKGLNNIMEREGLW